jgi:predicted MPP superfamily phosphohydrolase
MIVFLVVFLLIYIGLHALVFWEVSPHLAGHGLLRQMTVAWMGLMVAAPVLVHLLERLGYEAFSRALAWPGYIWMGLVFLVFCLCAILGAGQLLVWLMGKAVALPSINVRGPVTAAAVVFISMAAGFYGWHEARSLRLETVRLTTDKFKARHRSLRMVQISDLHLGLIHRDETLRPIIARIESLAPDILGVTGDLVDAQINHLDGLSELWQQVAPPLGKFAVIGNHEVYAGLGQSLEFMRRSGFTVLRNQMVVVGDILALAGVDDDQIKASSVDEAMLLKQAPPGLFTVFLKHRPSVSQNTLGWFDLQLSGHTHRGQIFPFSLLTGLVFPMQDGLYALAGGATLYASRGTGTWGPPMRVLSPPEITLFEIVGTI